MQLITPVVERDRAPLRRPGRRIVVHSPLEPCEACGEPTVRALCDGCFEHSRPHLLDDPYDDLGGEAGCE